MQSSEKFDSVLMKYHIQFDENDIEGTIERIIDNDKMTEQLKFEMIVLIWSNYTGVNKGFISSNELGIAEETFSKELFSKRLKDLAIEFDEQDILGSIKKIISNKKIKKNVQKEIIGFILRHYVQIESHPGSSDRYMVVINLSKRLLSRLFKKFDVQIDYTDIKGSIEKLKAKNTIPERVKKDIIDYINCMFIQKIIPAIPVKKLSEYLKMNFDNKITVLNVLQGDSCIFSPPAYCKYEDYDIYIDVGSISPKKNVFRAPHKEKLIILLSHSHEDHIGGLINLINDKSKNNVKEIWLPLYYNEINKIISVILKFPATRHVSANNANLINANIMLTVSELIKNLLEIPEIQVKGLYEGIDIYEQFQILNPPLESASLLNLNPDTLTKFIVNLKKNNYSEILEWVGEPENSYWMYSLLSEEWNQAIPMSDNEKFPDRMRFFYGMFLYLKDEIEDFIEQPSDKSFNKIMSKIKLVSNDTSIILKYCGTTYSALFTGDAGIKVFDRLIKENVDLKSTVLKVPHHGSKNNINERILRIISPEYAIVSHNNATFGPKATDSHPNESVIKQLDKMEKTGTIKQTIYTNDIEKKNNPNYTDKKYKKPDETFENPYIQFNGLV